MNGAVTSISDLREWFFANNRPHFVLTYASNPGQKTLKTVLRNDSLSNMDEAWALLERQVEIQTKGGRAGLELSAFEEGKQTHPLKTNIDIYGSEYYPMMGRGITPAIAGQVPDGYISKSDLQNALAEEREKWELQRRVEDLEAAQGAPQNVIERGLAILGEHPHLAALAQNLLVGFMGKSPVNMQAVNGTTGAEPGTPAPAEQTDEAHDVQKHFEQSLQQAAATLNVDPYTLVVRLNELVQQNPTVAKQLLSNDNASEDS